MLRHTPFHSRTAALMEAQQWRRWAGYLVASAYEMSHEREYHAIRSSAALFDVSPLYKYAITGRDAARLLDRVVTRDVAQCQPCQVLYTPWCDARGKVLDDGTVQRLGERHFRLTSADPNMRWLHENARGMQAEIADESERVAALSLQGPLARAILEEAAERDLSSLKFFRITSATLGAASVTISRTGYTGDLGFEIWLDREDAPAVWDALMRAGAPYGITPAGMLALDIARIEAGLILLDVDYISARKALIPSQLSSPYELSLGWTLAKDKPAFNGARALREEAARGPSWRLVGLAVDWTSVEREFETLGLAPHLPSTASRISAPVYAGGRQIGYATSSTWSPLLKRYIALAHLEAPSSSAAMGSEVELEITVEHRRRRAAAHVRPLPFFDPPRKRA
ncbi:MAG: aminomethyltransferase family protein [Gemmatimonadaceae bacterium]